MLTVGKFAFNRARMRHQALEYPRESLPAIILLFFCPFLLSIFFISSLDGNASFNIAKRYTIILKCVRTYREAPIHDGNSRSSADDVSRV